jgi:hypothetical protein
MDPQIISTAEKDEIKGTDATIKSLSVAASKQATSSHCRPETVAGQKQFANAPFCICSLSSITNQYNS